MLRLVGHDCIECGRLVRRVSRSWSFAALRIRSALRQLQIQKGARNGHVHLVTRVRAVISDAYDSASPAPTDGFVFGGEVLLTSCAAQANKSFDTEVLSAGFARLLCAGQLQR